MLTTINKDHKLDPIDPQVMDAPSVVATLRQRIIDGRLPAGTRLVEIPVAESLGVSRTPVRLAFRTLEQEGLLDKAGKRGYVVRSFSDADVRTAIEVRGLLEGLAVRQIAERGLTPALREVLAACLADGDAVLSRGHLVDDDIGRWSRLNHTFHQALVQAYDSRVIADAIARNDHLPFASAGSITLDRSALAAEYEKLRIAQLQHRLVVDALAHREPARAEMLMREHAWVGFRYGRLFGGPAAEGLASG